MTARECGFYSELIIRYANHWGGAVLQYDFENSINYWLVLTAQACERALSEQLAPEGITYRQAQVLAWLAHDGDMSQTELADRMRIEPPTLVGILDRMEREGWVARQNCSADRRRKLVTLGPNAEATWRKLTGIFRSVRGTAVQGLTEREVETLKGLLVRVQQNLKSTPVKASA